MNIKSARDKMLAKVQCMICLADGQWRKGRRDYEDLHTLVFVDVRGSMKKTVPVSI
jgi:hypothetical protein